MTKKDMERHNTVMPYKSSLTEQMDNMAIDQLEEVGGKEIVPLARSEEEKRKITQKDLMWVPVCERALLPNGERDKATSIWAARSLDGKRFYNVRRMEIAPSELRFGFEYWEATWCTVETSSGSEDGKLGVEKYGDIDRIGSRWNNRYDAQEVCSEWEGKFELDEAGLAAEKNRKEALNADGWIFQGVFAGLSIWSLRAPNDTEHCYVITHNMEHAGGMFSLSLRQMGNVFHRRSTGDAGYRKLQMKSLGVYPSLEQAKDAVKLIGN